jgi:hypothetical protein
VTQRTVLCFTAALVVLVGLGSSAEAAPITWEFQGTVRYVNLGDASALAGGVGVGVGASTSGRVTYESTTPDLVPGSGTYSSAVTGFEVAIGSYEVGALVPSSFNAFYVRLAPSPGPFDLEFADGGSGPDGLFPSGPFMTLALIADTPGVIPDSSLPTAPPLLSALRPFSIEDWLTIGYGTGCSSQRRLRGRVGRANASRARAGTGAFALLALAFVALARGEGRPLEPALSLALGLCRLLRRATAPITWAFEGTVRILEGETVELAGSLGVTLGAPVSGHVRYRDDVFSVGGPVAGIFDGALLGFEVAIGSFETGFESMFGCCHFDVHLNPGYGDSYALSGGGGGPDILFPQGVPLSLYLFADTRA